MRIPARVLGLLLLCLSACAMQPIGRVPPVDPQVAAEIVVIHNGSGAREEQMLTLDGQAIATLPQDGYTRFAVQPGPHWLGVGCPGVLHLSWTGKHRPFLADPRTTYYFLVAAAPGCANIEPMTEAQAQELMSQSTYRPIAHAGQTS